MFIHKLASSPKRSNEWKQKFARRIRRIYVNNSILKLPVEILDQLSAAHVFAGRIWLIYGAHLIKQKITLLYNDHHQTQNKTSYERKILNISNDIYANFNAIHSFILGSSLLVIANSS